MADSDISSLASDLLDLGIDEDDVPPESITNDKSDDKDESQDNVSPIEPRKPLETDETLEHPPQIPEEPTNVGCEQEAKTPRRRSKKTVDTPIRKSARLASKRRPNLFRLDNVAQQDSTESQKVDGKI